ncbi:TadE/TadG family type IV pilus assembly protein [Pseudomonas sp. NW5]|uniref:TadE/TadG family type IV pilus assembly protein n=1 Tax=Pseudomonas sp. NW5 TaxID=2934934 RepID=UPI0020215E10|nr:TadE/TadG family type IV pilus assembly protein [Pseudomonas sp. NW5]MCL7461217.1 Tad domain-containing protein [Pseudomonas sp. NW5]
MRNIQQLQPCRQRGAVAVLLTVAMLALLVMAGLALDGGHLLLNKTRLQNAVDAAALSGAKTLLRQRGNPTDMEALARADALDTLARNAAAVGNEELAERSSAADFAVVEFSRALYGPYSTSAPADAAYVRVSVEEFGLTGFFWRLMSLASGSSLPDKEVAAVAVAGPSPSAPCDLVPILVCVDPSIPPSSEGYWGFRFGELSRLSTPANNQALKKGEYLWVDMAGIGGGANELREALACGSHECLAVGQNVNVQPGQNTGPVQGGVNARFEGSNFFCPNTTPPARAPRDLVTTFTQRIVLDGEVAKYAGEPVVADADGNLTAGTQALFDYQDWARDSANCLAGTGGASCNSDGAYQRRILPIVLGDCTGKVAGKVEVPIVGFGCFYLVQDINNPSAPVFGQFVESCETTEGYPTINPSATSGPQVIQLFKAYQNDGQPGQDS